MKPFKLKRTALLLVLAFTITSCTSTKTAPFDLHSYQKTIAVKVETIKLMEKATAPFAVHKMEINALLLDIEKLTEYEKNKLHNEITFSMWKILNDKDKNLLVGFFKRWETKGILSPAFIQESEKQVLQALDLLIQYEAKKDKESKDALLYLINSNT
ncbi:hypothetical protein [Flavobacterium sp. UGB4466]|uniref:hypothetical protein n=1 Tax=Flavobacterium sp. UGB4466 TaxID=2730889 RepID=UPI00192B2B59|nr:hypothetical protein [Flavobacterium sp. UGB4466]